MNYTIRTTRLSVLPVNEPIFSEMCTHISIEDDDAGEYLAIVQQATHVEVKPQTISISPDEWPMIKQAVDTMLAEIKKKEDRK